MKRFKIEVRSAFHEWDRYDVYMTAVCLGADGEMTDYVSLTDKTATLETPPCDHADLYLYVIAREFPASEVIAASPPFDISVSVSASGSKPTVTTYPVNQWGGLSVKQSLD
ncbi:MAG: hypothetical protein LBU97_04035 [Alistipes sp.]|jgi:hypothetical protein|nr:hypothetical protein [Alistipes sp.]